MDDNRQNVWLFKFSLESDTGEKLDRSKAELLMGKIIRWAEKNDCQIGGGYRKPDDGEFDQKDIFDID